MVYHGHDHVMVDWEVSEDHHTSTREILVRYASDRADLNTKEVISLPTPSVASLRKSRALSDAVNAMRCMILPGCYPDVRCGDGSEPMKLPQGKTWEQHSFCTDDLAASSDKRQVQKEKCLVYSFGVHDSTEWEQKVAREFGCDVFAFDPTSDFESNVAPGVTFHKLGLQGVGVDVSKTHSSLYSALDPAKLRSLGDIRRMLGHENRQVDVLRLDCEGCEWGVLKQLACSDDSRMVDQLMVEMHFQKNLGIATDDDLLIAADAITCLEEKRWGLVSMEFSGCDPIDADYIPSMLKLIKRDFLYMLLYATFRRIPVEEQLYKENDHTFTQRFKENQVYTMKT
eukprot:CCRYP_006945-RA/>CCRYP_006945-RA protein AED:0.14 eAED:0.14 QI:0/-1/0/1/-1/1/1/0/340